MNQFQQITATRREIRRYEKRQRERAFAAQLRADRFQIEINQQLARWDAQFTASLARPLDDTPPTLN